MANTIRIKRRLAGGGAGAPSSLENAELAFNEQDSTLYYGVGTGGVGGSASSILSIAGPGAFATLGTAQTISGAKTFSGNVIVPTQAAGDSSTKAASTAFVKAQNYLTGNQSISISGDASGSGTTSISLTLAATGTAGTYTKVTTDSKGRVTTGTTLSATDIPTLTAAKISDFDTQVRTSRLDQMAAPTAAVSLNSQKITGLAAPTADTDAANKAYVDAARSGLDVKESCRAASTATVGTYNATGGAKSRGQLTACPNSLDGVTLVAGNRLLIKDHSTPAANGIYVVSTLGAGANGIWDRATDFDDDAEVTANAFTFVSEGTAHSDSGWVLPTNDNITIGGASGTALTFTQFSGAGQITAGAGLTKTANTIDIVAVSSARIVVNADSIDLATIGTAGTYRSVTTDAYGRVTAGTNPTTLSGYGITDAQPLDATLTALAGITVAANQLIYATGADAFAATNLTAWARTLLDDADATAGRATLGLGSIAVQNSSAVSITGGTIDGITLDGGTF